MLRTRPDHIRALYTLGHGVFIRSDFIPLSPFGSVTPKS